MKKMMKMMIMMKRRMIMLNYMTVL